ncbi:hypothetical protein [Nitratiruptor tergarcus]|uniref:Uncharacterized protein n=1 Tax=Nitratiruptor tergarcus DSM 16512 TaxID=1069081 RepID=A0A1W1WSD2_9BACT|nr:hypothetical protein [Nitratiruptor tergarcus]SMC09115.1 hypothetical protein SAMN05660197_0913 [Nitratiruptor tergarcus DSM 16512]
MRLFAFVALLLLGCSYKSVELSPQVTLVSNTSLHIVIEEQISPLLGYIVDKNQKIPIKIDKSIGSLLKAKLSQTKNKKLATYAIHLKIQKVRIVYFPQKSGNNLFGKLLLEVRLSQKNRLLIKKIAINRALHIIPIDYEKKIEQLLYSMIEEAVGLIEEMV